MVGFGEMCKALDQMMFLILELRPPDFQEEKREEEVRNNIHQQKYAQF